MVSLSDVRAHNNTLKSLAPGLVAVFVGGTSGIGLYTAREFARNTLSPKIYLVGRNQTEASRIIEELRTINSTSELHFIQKDVSLLRNVDEACKEIKEREKKVNLLFMTIGYLTLKGRDETIEGLDRKFSLHYYARMRFIQQLSPLLTAAANDPDSKANLSRVVSVLDPRIAKRFVPNYSDLSLKNNFSLKNCAIHASAMGNLTLEHFAKQSPGTSFIHASPGGVETGANRELTGRFGGLLWSVAAVLFKPWMVEKQESGERHLFTATASRFAPKERASSVVGVAEGSDGVTGSGSYHTNWDNELSRNSKTEDTMRADGAEEKIWKHTEEVFKHICDDNAKY